ncbi:MAG: potassium channel family protein, partial [Actinomycetota bacterium]|nr:potassium channel family protein [Actinomycetota bacterium]
MKNRRGKSRFWHLRMAIFAFVILALVSTIGYMIIEDLNFMDAFYMTVITISTVGYSEVHPLSSGGRVFTTFIIVISLAVVVYLTTSVVELLLEGRMLDVMGRRKTLRELKEITGHCIICGYGRIGKQVARECK